MLFNEKIESVILDNNGFTSGGFNMILEGLTSLERIKKLVYKNNRMDSNVPMGPNGPLRELMLRQEPHHLDELRITNCKLGSYFLNEILDTCLLDHCQLRKLGLVNVNMLRPGAERIMEVLTNN